ncbi:threonine/serine ThrE exporter family protein [Thiofilum flexile]|uniref:threonine/serine ThrE exporter family protein n=1 Tax=Thiofilum flexile TaxID=125627 RepID=UPI0003789C56|nr:threonine/serine exporter family protein [Thiofilum flexile]
MTKTEFNRIRRFVIRLGKTLHEYGTPAHRLEGILIDTTRQLGLEGAFLVTPTSLTFVFWERGSDEELTYVARVYPNTIDLNRLAAAHQLVEQVLAGQVTLDQGFERLEEINKLPSPYSDWLDFLTWGSTSLCFAALCGADIVTTLGAMFAGWLAYFLSVWSIRSKRVEEMLEPLAALLIALIGSGFSVLGVKLNVPILVLSGIIIFIPGLTLTTGLRELAARHLMSGTARVMDASMTLFKLYFGTLLGLALGTLWWGYSSSQHIALVNYNYLHYLAVLGLAASLLVTFKMNRRDAFWGLLSGCIAYLGALLGSHWFGAHLGGLVGALIVGVYANLYSLIRNVPTNLVLLPGLVFLVPGSKVYVGLNSLVFGENILMNSMTGVQVFLIFMSIVAGLMFANAIVPPKQRL